MEELIKKLQYAKNAVVWLLEHERGLVDMHSISYWAGEVERLRQQLRDML